MVSKTSLLPAEEGTRGAFRHMQFTPVFMLTMFARISPPPHISGIPSVLSRNKFPTFISVRGAGRYSEVLFPMLDRPHLSNFPMLRRKHQLVEVFKAK